MKVACHTHLDPSTISILMKISKMNHLTTTGSLR
ncbi:MAG: hypothetical protein ACI9LM_005411, partial [Alteromonadaceae bacterium]